MSDALIVVPTGVANLATVFAAFQRFSGHPVLSSEPDRILNAQRLVLPGVGAFGPAWARLSASGVSDAIIERMHADRSTLAICLGMHLLSEGSAESDLAGGLGLIPGRAERFQAGVRVPQMGWNRIEAPVCSRLLSSGDAYFANSYRLPIPADSGGWRLATSDHGGPFWSAGEKGRSLLCQFHPELSGAFGAALLKRWYEAGEC